MEIKISCKMFHSLLETCAVMCDIFNEVESGKPSTFIVQLLHISCDCSTEILMATEVFPPLSLTNEISHLK